MVMELLWGETWLFVANVVALVTLVWLAFIFPLKGEPEATPEGA